MIKTYSAIWYLWYNCLTKNTYNIRVCYSRQFVKNS